MPILLFTNENIPTFVERQIYTIDGLTEEDKVGSIEVEELPKFENNGKLPQLHINRETKEMWYEYIDIPKTENEILLDTARLEMAQANTEMFEMIMAMQSEVSK